MSRRGILLLLALAGAGLAGTVVRARAQGRTVTVFAAASLTDAFNAIAPEFERANPGVKLRFSYASSSVLRTQIQQGAPADVFAAADRPTLQPLVDAGLVAAPRIFARNQLTVVIPAANPGKVRTPKDLARPGLRLVATSAAVPIGHYTQEVLDRLARLPGYGADFKARVNANVVSRETNVRAVLSRVSLGEADAALVYETDAKATPRVATVPLPEPANVTAEYPIAVVSATGNRPAAEAFVRWVSGSKGRAVLRRFGFR